MKLPLALLAFVGLLVAAFVALAPASLADRQVASATAGRVRLADATGTVWRGAGVLTDPKGAWRVPVAWRMSPLALVRGALDVELAPQGRIVANGGLAVSGLRVALPAAVLAAALPAVPAVDAGGELVLEAPAFRYDGHGGDGAVSLRWDRARVVVNGALVDLGNAAARVAPRGADLAGTLTNEGGAVRVAGDALWTQGQLAVNATLRPVGLLPPQIAQALNALGPPDPSGAVRVSWRSALR